MFYLAISVAVFLVLLFLIHPGSFLEPLFLAPWQVSGGINRVTIFPNFKMQHRLVRSATAQFGNYLTCFYALPFLHQNLAIVCVCTQIVFVVVHDNQVPVTKQPVSCVNHTSICCCSHSIPGSANNINAFVDFSRRRIRSNYGASMRPTPLDIGNGLATG